VSKGTRTVLRGGDDGNVAPLTRPVDFDFKGDTFHNEWQSYRTKANKAIATMTTNTYDSPGTYCVNVKVIDILGNDTTRTLQVEIA